MKKTTKITFAAACILSLASCESALDPMISGHYTDENLDEFPSIVQGFVEYSYNIARTGSYLSDKDAYLDCATDVGMLTNENSVCRKMANTQLSPNQDSWSGTWRNDYLGITYANRFLLDDVGYNTHLLVSQKNDKTLRKDLKGDAFALRAWFEYDLLYRFGGKGMDGNLLGFVIMDKYTDQSTADPASYSRASYDDCVAQILADCDSAIAYLPLANRDWIEGLNLNVEGSQRWGRFDAISMVALKAMTCLLWASDNYNPSKDTKRWEKAAQFAAEAMKFKLDYDFPHAGKDVTSSFSWMDPNTPECYLPWTDKALSTSYEVNLYPAGFRGSAVLGPTQELVDAFPMANGYPITDSRSGYDPKNPYSNRDPRFYANIFYNGANVVRAGKTDVMYTFDMTEEGPDVAGNPGSSMTNYYLKKFIYLGYNQNDQIKQTQPKVCFPICWRDMCLIFAEAANRAYGPNEVKHGFSAKEALSYIRNRTTADGTPGLGVNGDPYLDECCSSEAEFEKLVRNERMIEFCFEGKRFYDLARWGVTPSERKDVHKVSIKLENGKPVYDFNQVVDRRKLRSAYLPIPYSEIVVARGIVQNEGWDNWTVKK